MIKICAVCKNDFNVKPSHFDKRFCCSKKCQSINQKNKTGKFNNNWKGGIKKKICKNCKNEFISKNPYSRSVFCSHKCSTDFSIGRKVILHQNTINYINQKKIDGKNNPDKKCVCGNKKELKSKNCKKCFHDKIKRKEKTAQCLNCKNSFLIKSSYKKKYCSSLCRKNNLSIKYLSDRNPNWKGVAKSENQVGRFSAKYIEWRNLVFIRDKFTCQKCNQIGKSLHSHHIRPWAKNPMFRYDLENGITLCKSCHKEVHLTKNENFLKNI